MRFTLAFSRPKRGDSGLTLLEMVGALALLAILAVLLLPPMIRRIDLSVRAREVVNLITVSNALVTEVVRNKRIPSYTNWESTVLQWASIPGNVTNNSRGYRRIYYVQNTTAAGPRPALGYVQDYIGYGDAPSRLRAVIVSILGGPALDGGNSPTSGSGPIDLDVDFDDLWKTPDGSVPTGDHWKWPGKSEDFLIQRIDYSPLIHRLVLTSRDSQNTARWRINGEPKANAVGITYSEKGQNVGWSRYYIDGSVVSLESDSGPMTRFVLRKDTSFIFELGLWRADIVGKPVGNALADEFAQHANAFMKAPTNPQNKSGANQQSVVTAMYDFMLTYTLWANQCPHFTWHSASSAGQVPEYDLLLRLAGTGNASAQTNKTDLSGHLGGFSAYLVQ